MHSTTVESPHPSEHPPFLAHHFASPEQQFDAGKLGMWLFLVTEILFFSGLFAVYAVYRGNHPEVFLYAHQFLDKTLGAVNTVVLLFSSLTMAWAVRCAQLGHGRGLVICLIITLACAGFFLGVKAVEYTHKWDEGLLWAAKYQPHQQAEGDLGAGHLTPGLRVFLGVVGVGTLIGAGAAARARRQGNRRAAIVWAAVAVATAAGLTGVAAGIGLPLLQHGSVHRGPFRAESARVAVARQPEPAATNAAATHAESGPRLAGVFFSIYFAMTGVHALHILAGMAVIAWLVGRAAAGHFGPGYFGPVDYVGLYWHLVDLVWIYLFPLLYLIH